MDAVAATAHETAVIAAVCAAVGLPRESSPRHLVAASRPLAPSPPRPKTARALATEERRRVLDQQREHREAGNAQVELYATFRRKPVQKVSASDAPTSMPSNSRCPSLLTPTAMITATDVMR